MHDHRPKHLSRRALLGVLTAVGGAAIAGACGATAAPTSPATDSTATGASSGGTTTSGACAVIPSETEGPYPDRTGMINNPAFLRRDVTEGKPGVPLTLALTIVSSGNGCRAVAGASVEIWHCDAAGNYSEYSQPGFNGTGQTFLRGVQTADSAGQVTFTTIYPGWYAGRATHIHVQVYINGSVAKTTQVAFPESITAGVYGTGIYASHGQNTTSNASDNVFSDGTSTEMATLSGNSASGYAASLTIAI